jgi:L-seryl-tRNA(Ser) seleniumtransferase
VSGPETIAIAKEHKLFTFNDAAADVPPVERLWKYPRLASTWSLSAGARIFVARKQQAF